MGIGFPGCGVCGPTVNQIEGSGIRAQFLAHHRPWFIRWNRGRWGVGHEIWPWMAQRAVGCWERSRCWRVPGRRSWIQARQWRVGMWWHRVGYGLRWGVAVSRGQQAAHRRDDSLGWSGHKNRTGWDWAGDWLRAQVLPCEVQVFVAPLRLQLLPSAHSLG